MGGLAFALDRGVDALVVSADDVNEAAGEALLDAAQIAKAQRLERHMDGDAAAQTVGDAACVALGGGVVVGVREGGVGDRVALDFTSMLRDDEGCAAPPFRSLPACAHAAAARRCLVGSSAKALVLVHGETVESGFVPPRPFRVNAGPVHSYVLMADGSARYLSEVRSGDRVLVVSTGGGARALTVGRCKQEPRPLLRVDFAPAGGGGGAQVFLQQAETVRLAEGGGGMRGVPVTEAAAGDALRVRWAERGTHVGREIGARVDER